MLVHLHADRTCGRRGLALARHEPRAELLLEALDLIVRRGVLEGVLCRVSGTWAAGTATRMAARSSADRPGCATTTASVEALSALHASAHASRTPPHLVSVVLTICFTSDSPAAPANRPAAVTRSCNKALRVLNSGTRPNGLLDAAVVNDTQGGELVDQIRAVVLLLGHGIVHQTARRHALFNLLAAHQILSSFLRLASAFRSP